MLTGKMHYTALKLKKNNKLDFQFSWYSVESITLSEIKWILRTWESDLNKLAIHHNDRGLFHYILIYISFEIRNGSKCLSKETGIGFEQ